MRLWSLDPAYLDAKGLVALWREGLLAQHVLLGKTRGYRHHPQLIRFRQSVNPLGCIASYLRAVCDEAVRRGYKFDRSKIITNRTSRKLPVTRGQVAYELQHLMAKLANRDPDRHRQMLTVKRVKLHPLFESVPGDIEVWEIT